MAELCCPLRCCHRYCSGQFVLSANQLFKGQWERLQYGSILATLSSISWSRLLPNKKTDYVHVHSTTSIQKNRFYHIYILKTYCAHDPSACIAHFVSPANVSCLECMFMQPQQHRRVYHERTRGCQVVLLMPLCCVYTRGCQVVRLMPLCCILLT